MSTSTIFLFDVLHNFVVLDWQSLMGGGHQQEVVTHGILTDYYYMHRCCWGGGDVPVKRSLQMTSS